MDARPVDRDFGRARPPGQPSDNSVEHGNGCGAPGGRALPIARSFAGFVIASALLVFFDAAAEAAETNDTFIHDELAVYRALVEAGQLPTGLKVIDARDREPLGQKGNDFLHKEFGENASEALENFFTKQGQEQALALALSKEQGWSFLDETVKERRNAGKERITFVEVRRVGFNRANDLAVVYIFLSYGEIEGSWYLLTRKDGKWKFVKKVVFVVS